MINMLQVILFILKAIGILLVSVLGILIFLILAFLFVPIRYSIQAKKYEEISVKVKLGWFFRILYFNMDYEKEKLSFQFRIFGFLLKGRKKQRKKKQKNKKMQKMDSSKIAKQRLIEAREERKAIKDENLQKDQRELEGFNEESESFTQTKSKLSFFSKMKIKIISMIEKIKAVPLKIKNLLLKLYHKAFLLKSFFQNEKNKEGIKKIWDSIKKLIKHLLPKKLEAEVRFGTGDPCSTGQILAAVSVVYPFYAQSVKIIPDFLESIIEGHVFMKGRIRLGTLLIITIKLIINRNFKFLYKNFNKLKEEL